MVITKEHNTKDGGWQASTLREALQIREWFMKNSRVEDASSRLCDAEGEWKRMLQRKILGEEGNVKFLMLPRHVNCDF